MKNKVIWFLALALFVSSLIFFKDALALRIAQKTLKKYFPSLEFVIRKFSIWPGSFEMSGLKARSAAAFRPKISIRDAKAGVKFSVSKFLNNDFFGLNYGHISSGEVRVEDFSFAGSKLDFYRALSGDSLISRLNISDVKYNDAKIKDFDAVFQIYPSQIFLQHARSKVFGGVVTATGIFVLSGKDAGITLELDMKEVDIRQVMQFFSLEKRIDSSGFFSGRIHLTSSFKGVLELSGRLNSVSGGKFLILDASMLDQGVGIKRSVETIVVENLKNYHYDIGYIDVANEGRNVKLSIQLQGQAGRRNLDVVWHGGVGYEKR